MSRCKCFNRQSLVSFVKLSKQTKVRGRYKDVNVCPEQELENERESMMRERVAVQEYLQGRARQ